MCGRLDGVGVGLPAQGPHLCLHLWSAARHPTGADLQVDACAKKGHNNLLWVRLNYGTPRKETALGLSPRKCPAFSQGTKSG